MFIIGLRQFETGTPILQVRPVSGQVDGLAESWTRIKHKGQKRPKFRVVGVLDEQVPLRRRQALMFRPFLLRARNGKVQAGVP